MPSHTHFPQGIFQTCTKLAFEHIEIASPINLLWDHREIHLRFWRRGGLVKQFFFIIDLDEAWQNNSFFQVQRRPGRAILHLLFWMRFGRPLLLRFRSKRRPPSLHICIGPGTYLKTYKISYRRIELPPSEISSGGSIKQFFILVVKRGSGRAILLRL